MSNTLRDPMRIEAGDDGFPYVFRHIAPYKGHAFGRNGQSGSGGQRPVAFDAATEKDHKGADHKWMKVATKEQRRISLSAIAQCSGNIEYGAAAARNRERLVALRKTEARQHV